MAPMGLLTRATGAAARRLGRPELLAAVNAAARQAQREEVGISAVLAGALGDAGAYVDVGTNRGQVLREAVRIAPGGRHVAFEPVPELAAEVGRRFPDVDCRQMALGASQGSAEFCHFRKLDGWSGLRRSPEISDEQGEPVFITVEVSTLDAELAGTTPRVLKIDVEGAELSVLEGGRSLLSGTRPLVIFEHVPGRGELYDSGPGAVWDLLAELDYRVFSLTGEGPFSRSSFAENTGVVNWLATPGARTQDGAPA
jgi:FkbM family methyltransferase